MTKGEELKSIRQAYMASRPQFGKVFLGGITSTSVYNYENDIRAVPENIMMLARTWKKYLDDMRGGE